MIPLLYSLIKMMNAAAAAFATDNGDYVVNDILV